MKFQGIVQFAHTRCEVKQNRIYGIILFNEANVYLGGCERER